MADSTSTIAASGGDYSTVQAWYDAKKNTAGTHTGNIKSGTYVGALLGVPSANVYFVLQAYNIGETDNRFKGIFNDSSPTYPIIGAATGSPYCISMDGQPGFTCSGLVFIANIAASITSVCGVNNKGASANSTLIIENCGFDIQGSYNSGMNVNGVLITNNSSYWVKTTVRCCVFRRIYGTTPATGTNDPCVASNIWSNSVVVAGNFLYVYNNVFNYTCANLSTSGSSAKKVSVEVNGVSLTTTCYNNYFCTPTTTGYGSVSKVAPIAFGTVPKSAWVAGTVPTIDIDYNGYQDSSATYPESNPHNQLSVVAADEFTNTTLATFDAHLKATTPKLGGKGYDLIANSKTNAPTTDIDGDPWT
jgi:hypothetical protein